MELIKSIPYGRQNISLEDIDAVVSILQSDYLTQGYAVPAFEERISQFCNSRYAVAVNSATSALHLACKALGVTQGDIVWTSPISFVASANCALYCQATVDFVDIDLDTGNIAVEILEKMLQKAKKLKKLPKVLIVVHMTGRPCNLQRINELSREYGFKVIEDASHAIGAEYMAEKIGSCRFSDVAVFSFHPVKIITTGEGGMIVTNDPNTAQKIKTLRSHGVIKDIDRFLLNSDGGWYYEQVDLGYNYRMNDIEAALGISQMNRISLFIAERRKLAKRYRTLLATLGVRTLSPAADEMSAWHLFPIFLGSSIERLAVFNKMRNIGIEVNVHYIPIYKQPYYKNLNMSFSPCPNAEKYYDCVLSLPIYFGLKEHEQDYIVGKLAEFMSEI